MAARFVLGWGWRRSERRPRPWTSSRAQRGIPNCLATIKVVRSFYVYIMASDHRTLYTGVTNDLEKRLFEHREGVTKGFTKKYNVHRLVYFEETEDPLAAIVREKQIKGWSRAKKVALIEGRNPQWEDLSASWDSKPRDPSSLRSSG